MDKKYLTIKEAAKFLGVTPLTLRNWDKKGKFSAGRHPISNYRIYKVEEIEALAKKIETGDARPLKPGSPKPKTKKLRVQLVDD